VKEKTKKKGVDMSIKDNLDEPLEGGDPRVDPSGWKS